MTKNVTAPDSCLEQQALTMTGPGSDGDFSK